MDAFGSFVLKQVLKRAMFDTILFMVFIATYNICKGSKLDT